MRNIRNSDPSLDVDLGTLSGLYPWTLACVIALFFSELQSHAESNPFQWDRLLDVEVSMPAEDWESLRYEHHDLFGLNSTPDRSKPRPNPYNYYRGDVTIDGVSFGNVGLRKKGLLGSVNAQRPSIKINFDKFGEEDQFEGISLMTLNNNDTDSSQVRQFLSYELFRKAGIAAPRSNFAKVTVNGKLMGIYSHVESVRKGFLKRNFKKSGGNLYEGAISDFTEKLAGTFDLKTNTKKADRSDLDAAVRALQADDRDLFGELGDVFDLDQFFRYWAMESLLGYNDGYSGNQNNFFIYNNPKTDLFSFIPWGTDGVFTGKTGKASRVGTPLSVMAEGVVPFRLYKTNRGKHRYRGELLALLDEVWDEDELLSQVDQIVDLVKGHLHIPDELFARSIDGVRSFIQDRRLALGDELVGPIPEWPRAMRGSTASGERQKLTVQCDFDSAWSSSLDGASTGSIPKVKVLLGGNEVEIVDAEFSAGGNPSSSRYQFPVLTFSGKIAGLKKRLMVNLLVEPGFYAPAENITVDGYTVWGFIRLGHVKARRLPRIGWAVGKLALSAAGTEPGSSVAGSFNVSCRVSSSMRLKPESELEAR